MPTKAEFQELQDNTTITWVENYLGTTINGILLTSENNGLKLFFPAAGQNSSWEENPGNFSLNEGGHYWSSSYASDYDAGQFNFGYYRQNVTVSIHDDTRSYGLSIRAVCE